MIFLKGLLIALIFGIPAGVIGILCVNRSIEKGFISGFATGLGSSLADTIYAIIGAFGITLISDFLQQHQKIIGITGGIFIFLYGFSMLRRKMKIERKETKLSGNFISSFVMAILNPTTILTFLIAFSSFKIKCENFFQSLFLVLGIFLGTVLWWFAISFTASRFREKFTEKGFCILRIICGIFLLGFGILCFVRSFR